MAKKSVEEIVTDIGLPIVEPMGFELVDVEYKKAGAHWYLRLYLDKPGGITIDDCQDVSEKISDILDEKDPIPHGYFLEVSSVGLDRPLKKDEDFERFKGEKVDIKLYKAIDGAKEYTGELLGIVDKNIRIKVGKEELDFQRNQVASVKLTVEI